MFKRILVANRGEIALRVIRSCQELGVETVAVYSEPDRESLHVHRANEAVCIGPREASGSYLNQAAIITAALATSAEAIHPGYGFLAENAQFAEACKDAGLTFIGPPSSSISRMGDKASARETMRSAGVPVVPGSDGLVSNTAEAVREAERIGYPVLIKAAAGGGGRGMRPASDAGELQAALATARVEAGAAFGDDGLYLERLVSPVRHVEIQVLADSHGNIVHLGERDCSVQRRRQKLLEEAPGPGISAELREHMGRTAVEAARAVGYQSAGTVEFIYEPTTGAFYFMEMNARIQVEHPVTEAVTGVDLVREQLLIAAGEPLKLQQSDVTWRGHAIECRINAEDPGTFMPHAGTVRSYVSPGGPWVRVDSHCYPGYSVLPFYDSLIAKLIVWAPSRDEAICRMLRALDEYVIEGIPTTIPFHQRVLTHRRFLNGELSTDFVERELMSAECAPLASGKGVL